MKGSLATALDAAEQWLEREGYHRHPKAGENGYLSAADELPLIMAEFLMENLTGSYQVALWAADCEAATAYHYERKSASKSERKRHVSICEDLIKMLKARELMGVVARKPEDVLRRLEQVVEHLKKIDEPPAT